ncbi:hypothetical protein ACH5RR_023454 [Cinchona calisaya]|uniref:Uncharacterized protein n=1 Tax=Cinchona calisaya TaxID=153742 RepID=A0ABD2ZAR1_9GENT
MADNTRLKTLEEQLRKQDSKIQGILENMASDKKLLEERLKTSNAELKGILNGLLGQFATFLRASHGEQGILGSHVSTGERNISLIDWPN